MRDTAGGGLTYEVVVEELARAAADVAAVTDSAREGTLEALPASIGAVGHDGLTTALHDFCARWDTGLSHLVGDTTEMSQRLTTTARCYTEESWATAQSFGATTRTPLALPGAPTTPGWTTPGWTTDEGGGAGWSPLTPARSSRR